MNIFHVIILSFIEGITEFLPISSTAHLEFTATLLGLIQDEFLSSFIIAIQSGAILAVAWLYRRKIFLSQKAFLRIIVGFIPTGVIGLGSYQVIKHFLLGNVIIGSLVLAIGGIIILLLEHWITTKQPIMRRVHEIEDLSYQDIIILGIIQSIAVIPGVSRSGALIVGGLIMRIPRPVIIETAFLLAIPTMLAATGYDLLQTGFSFSSQQWLMIGLGVIASALVAYGVAKWLLDYVRKSSFAIFGWYRIIVGAILLITWIFWF